MNKPTLRVADILDVLHRIDAGKVRLSAPEKSCDLWTYRASNGWRLTVLADRGMWRSLVSFETGGSTHDLWHHLYDEDHRKDRASYQEVRDFRPARPERYRLAARASGVKKKGNVRPAYTKNGRRAFMPSVHRQETE